MKKAVLIFSIICAFVLAGCSNNQEKAQETPKFLDVKLTVNPEKAKVNQPVTFEAKVTYGKEAVTDADDVKFEIWRANDKNHEKIQVKHAENGIYRLKKVLTEKGHIISFPMLQQETCITCLKLNLSSDIQVNLRKIQINQ